MKEPVGFKNHLNRNVFFRASKKRKVFSEPILYEDSQEKASGVMTLSDYSKFDMYQQKEAELTQLGLTQVEVELKMVDCGLLSKVCIRRHTQRYKKKVLEI